MPTSTARSTQFLLERFSPKQILSFYAANRRINLWEGAVSSGKTIASLWAWLTFVESASTSGELVMIGKTRDAVYRNALQPLMNYEIFEDLSLQVDYNPGAPTARIFGRLVHVIGANDVKSENKIRGMTCVGAYVDEATLLPETFWDMLRTRMRAPGARIFATTNPDSPTHWLREKFIDEPEVRRSMKVFSFELDDNIHLTADYVEETKRMYSGLFYRRFILGEWCAAEGAVFDMFDRSRHVVDILPPITRWLSLGIDYGTSNPTHAVLLGMGSDGCLYAAADWRYDGRKAQRQITDLETSERLREWLGSVRPPGTRERGIRPGMVAVDPSAASFHAQLRRDGLAPRPAHNKVLSGVRILMALFAADKLRVHSSCKELLKEIDGYVWDPKATERGEDAPLKQNDHGVDALRYAVKTTQHIWRPQIDIPLSQADREDERAA
ncbi:PBSX family phage terminase large subunit [Streptomyces sp. MMBL 11-3]|uniref:PBSX family phage terminase large subunit n=1 Tax=Streptomyces sp. MMBL 11-3 TaxID=3382639 RepID=UPI0039B66848